MTLTVINDFVSDRRTEITFNHPQDFVRAEAQWEMEDPLLTKLQNTDAFRGMTRWCDLNPVHYRFLLSSILDKVSKLSDEDQSDPMNEAMVNLTFCLTLMIKCLEDRSESVIELMHINRLGDKEVLYDFTATVNMQIDLRPKRGFKVIVDNT
jgi:hypothetical protein